MKLGKTTNTTLLNKQTYLSKLTFQNSFQNSKCVRLAMGVQELHTINVHAKQLIPFILLENIFILNFKSGVFMLNLTILLYKIR